MTKRESNPRRRTKFKLRYESTRKSADQACEFSGAREEQRKPLGNYQQSYLFSLLQLLQLQLQISLPMTAYVALCQLQTSSAPVAGSSGGAGGRGARGFPGNAPPQVTESLHPQVDVEICHIFGSQVK